MDFNFQREVDRSNMKKDLFSWPEQIATGWEQGRAAASKYHDAATPSHLIWAGMGGSAISGDFLNGLLADTAPFPLTVHRGGPLPAWAGEGTAIVLASYSGNTAETLATANEAIEKGCTIYALTSGGKLAEMAGERGFETWTVHGGRMPRAALGEAFGTALGAFHEHGWINIGSEVIDETISTLKLNGERLSADPSESGHPLHNLLTDVLDKHPMIYGSGAFVPVARRWAAQINENGKRAAQWGVMPEMNHNEVVPYVEGGEWGKWYSVMILDDPEAPADVRKRIPITAELAKKAGWSAHIVRPSAKSTLARMLELTLLGDWLSYWLALAQGIDPSPIPTIMELKARLED
ncbi:bifunctional phosphoglucose/phosphomannose isomerase [bacterium BMS3Bbin04]|nr:bifunctional phosphoglucose/phosphomannose isomerase [bacterium BMS3Bbin04]